jgi:Chaperone of endosialidase
VISGGNLSLDGNIVDNGYIIYQQPFSEVTNTAVGVNSFGGTTSSGTGNTASGYCSMNGNPGACSNGGSGNARPIPRVPHAQGSGDDPHPDTSSGVTGSYNTAHGYLAMSSLNDGYYNTAHGAFALSSLTNGYFNTAAGYYALSSLSGGYYNTAHGAGALSATTTGNFNAATGSNALANNTTGSSNTAHGDSALSSNTTGSGNTATGGGALYNNSAGNYNTAIGTGAGGNSTGSNNIAVGHNAGLNVSGGNSNSIYIGSAGSPGDGNPDGAVIRIGGNTALGDPATQTAFYASGIGNATVSGVPVLVNTSTGQLGIASSSRRFKEDIQDMSDASDGLMRLRPVTFRYKQPFDDGAKPMQYGLIAEEVAEVYPDLVARSADGQIETVKYQLLDPMLLNEVQKQSHHTEQQDETIRRQQEQVLKQQEQIRSLEARLAALEGLLSGKVPTTATAGQ